ncbi:transcriptional regulator GutM [Virgibacillus necropolis]|uniref:Transcriptional regulator n=1 Tax=Virgibacillus necropolis TaxID=163877 RepID=A0A221M9P2_9BACI|nr:transcriptional regulator GutM [Virgibacillus necropolis]ASN04374.1 hypothetical protein CFK40_04795 [Virgibacillus necropolis]
MWGTFILVFAAIWALQYVLTQIQVKHYRASIKEFAKLDSGYLGTGFYRKKLGTGALVMLVCDEQSQVVEAKVMKGITVFARFKSIDRLKGMKLEESKHADFLLMKEKNALEGAINMIEKEMNKRKENEAWIS